MTFIGDDSARVVNSKLTRTNTGIVATVTVKGKLSSVQTAAGETYKIGEKISVLGEDGLEITQLDLNTEDGGIGVLTVTASKGKGPASSATPAGQPANYNIEVDFTTITKALATHPEYDDLDEDDWKAIRAWESLAGEMKYAEKHAKFLVPSEEAMQKKDGPDPTLADDWEELDGLVKNYAEHIAKGVTEYMVQVPVIRRTSQEMLNSSNSISKVGKKVEASELPGTLASALDLVWMKTADRWSRNSKSGLWSHYEEWAGFDELDEVLYGDGYSGGSGGGGGGGGGDNNAGGGE